MAIMNFGGTIRLNKVGMCVVLGVVILLVFYLSPRVETDPFLGTTKVNLRRLLLASIDAAERGGAEVIRTRSEPNLNEKSKGKTKEGAESLVTNADYRSHCIMYYGIKKIFPNIKVISEEKKQEKECSSQVPLDMNPKGISGLHDLHDEEVEASKVAIWIDPLDATQEYTENILDCVTTMVCITYDGSPLIGIIHKPFGIEPKTTWAWLLKGKSPHLKPKLYENTTKTVIISRSHPGEVESLMRKAFGNGTNIIKAGGAGFKVLEVIAGNASAYIHTTAIKKWDICAGDVILTAVDGSFSALDNKEIDYSGDSGELHKSGILATLKNHEEYIAAIRRARGL